MRYPWALAILSALSGCSFLLDEGFTDPSSDPTGDGGSSEAAPDALVEAVDSGPDAVVDAGPVGGLLGDNAGFEVDRVRCGSPWAPSQGATLTLIDRGRQGFACRPCRLSSGADWFGVYRPFEPRLGPGTYRFEGWYRRHEPSTTVDGCELGLDLRDAQGAWRQVTTSGCEPGFQDWQRLSGTAVVEEGEVIEEFYAAARGGTESCFDVDDLSVTKID